MKKLLVLLCAAALLLSPVLADDVLPPDLGSIKVSTTPSPEPDAPVSPSPSPDPNAPVSPSPSPEPVDPSRITAEEALAALIVNDSAPISLKLDGAALELGGSVCPPLILRSRTVVPVRGVFEALGASVNWDDATHSVSVIRGDTTIHMTLGSDSVSVNGAAQTLEFAVPAIDHDGDGNVTTLLPLRFVLEAAGLFVRWSDASRTVKIFTAEPTMPDIPDWCLLLVNRWNPLPAGFSVELGLEQTGRYGDARVIDDLNAMMNACKAAGMTPYICPDSYRSFDTQNRLYQNRVARYMADTGCSYEDALYPASMWVAAPGTSEHQAGLAFDIVSYYHPALDSSQESTAEQQWLMAHSWEYGFILRYPTGKSDVTGVGYEPWHYRYVGREAAELIYDSGLCLEEWLPQYKG